MRTWAIIAAATLAFAATAWAEPAAPAKPDPNGPTFKEMKTDFSTPPVTAPAPEPAPADAKDAAPEAFDLAKLKAMVADFDQALYLTQQDKISTQITGRLVMQIEDLMAAWRAEKDPSLDLIRLMGFARTDDANAELRKLLDSPDASKRAAAAFALGVAQDAAALTRLTVMLDDPDPKVARQAAMAIGRLRDKTCYESIEKRLDSKDPLMRLAAIKAIGLLGDPRAQARLEDYLRTHDDPIETVAVLDALNLIAGDNLFRIIDQLDRIAGALQQRGTGRQTQLAQAAVTDALDRVIEKAQKQQQGGGGGGGKKRQTSSQSQPQPGGGTGKSQGGASPAQASHNNAAPQMEGTLADIQRTAGSVWGNLPPAVQEEVTAALKQELPERYQQLLKVYYKILAEGK